MQATHARDNECLCGFHEAGAGGFRLTTEKLLLEILAKQHEQNSQLLITFDSEYILLLGLVPGRAQRDAEVRTHGWMTGRSRHRGNARARPVTKQ